MFRHPQVITEEIRDDILFRSSLASSRDDITRAIFHALVKAGVDWRTVPLDEIKGVLVEANRVFEGRMVRYATRFQPRLDDQASPGYAVANFAFPQ